METLPLHWALIFGGSIFSLLLAIIGFFAVRTLKQLDSNQANLFKSQTKLYEKISLVERDFYVHKGMCSVIHGRRHDDIILQKEELHEEGP